jgi:hypothetical protein
MPQRELGAALNLPEMDYRRTAAVQKVLDSTPTVIAFGQFLDRIGVRNRACF